jgi:DNA-binding NarL/FixJ family response regulator
LLRILQEKLESGPVTSPSPPEPGTSTGLSARELEVLKLLAAGHDTATIARRLSVSPATVRNHVQSILRKLCVHSRLEAITYAMRRRWC